MKHVLHALAFFAAIFLPIAGLANPGSIYQVELTLERSGLATPFTTTLLVAPTKEAVVSLLHPHEPIGHQLRLVVGSPFVAPNGKSAAELRIEIFEQVGREWSLRASPSMGIEIGKDASMDAPLMFAEDGGTYNISVTVTQVALEESMAMAGHVSASAVACEPDLLAPLQADIDSGNQSRRGERSCCRAPCVDGSNYTMTCCGAVWCCACGTCCYPP